MSESQRRNEVSVDRREEMVVTQQPGYASTEQFTRDVAAERRLRVALITQIIWAVLGLLEVLLGLRFLLKLIAANPNSGFAVFIYGITKPFLAPFTALVGTPTSGGTILETTTLIAMAVYALLFWVVVRVVRIAATRPSARTVTTSVREQTPGGTIAISRLRGTPDDGTAAPRLTSLIALGTVEWQSHQGESSWTKTGNPEPLTGYSASSSMLWCCSSPS